MEVERAHHAKRQQELNKLSSCCHFVSLTALIAPCRTALLPASCWHLCWRSAGVIAHVAPGSTSLLCWRCHPCCIIAVIVLAFLLPSLHPRCCQHHAGIFAGITLALLPSLHSCTLPCCAGVVTSIASAFCCAVAFCCPPLWPLIQLVVASPLLMPPPFI